MAKIDVVAALKDLQIKSGPFKGGFEVAPNGKLNWYFANLGLICILPRLTAEEAKELVLPYMNLYIANLKPDKTIDDVLFPVGRADHGNYSFALSDSDDSYAATFFSLVEAYRRETLDIEYVKYITDTLIEMAAKNHLNNRKENGLVSTFQYPRRASYDVSFLMDNCEVVGGLYALSIIIYLNPKYPDSTYRIFSNAANSIAYSLKKLYVPENKAFKWADINSTALDTSFYPGCTSQIFPQLCNVPQLHTYFKKGYDFLNKYASSWETGKYDAFPWLSLGYVSAKRGFKLKPRKQLLYAEKLFVENRAMVTINELGFYSLTQKIVNNY